MTDSSIRNEALKCSSEANRCLMKCSQQNTTKFVILFFLVLEYGKTHESWCSIPISIFHLVICSTIAFLKKENYTSFQKSKNMVEAFGWNISSSKWRVINTYIVYIIITDNILYDLYIYYVIPSGPSRINRSRSSKWSPWLSRTNPWTTGSISRFSRMPSGIIGFIRIFSS